VRDQEAAVAAEPLPRRRWYSRARVVSERGAMAVILVGGLDCSQGFSAEVACEARAGGLAR
jgi:hypothetical protein